MYISDFFEDHQTKQFIGWLSSHIDGTAERDLNFLYEPDRYWSTLTEARDAYKWPAKRTSIPTPRGELILTAWSDLAENQRVLDMLSKGLRESLANPVPDEGILADWVQAILVWGGVYTRHKNGGGNAGWLETRRQEGDLAENLHAALREAISFESGPKSLRSNAGLTKVYSLAQESFIIYDSRVAAALSWLVMRWACEVRLDPIPEHLRFACMRANQGNLNGERYSSAKVRSPDTKIFPYFAPATQLRDHWRHAVWNQRANYVLTAALDQARSRQPTSTALNFQTVRDVEAALFVLGANLRYAL